MFIFFRFIFDILFILVSYILAYQIRFESYNIALFSFQQYSNYLFSILLIYLFSFYFSGMYKVRKGFLIEVDEFLGSFLSVTFAWAVLIVLTFIYGEYEYSRPIIILSWPISFILITISREIIIRVELWARARGYDSKRAAIIGTGELAQSVAQRIRERPSYGVNFIGFIGENGNEVIGKLNNLDKIVDEQNIQMLYVADKSYSRKSLTELATFCGQKGIALGTIPDIFEILTTSPAVEDIEGLPIISLKQTHFTPFNRFIKRTFDVLFSVFGIIIFSILMAIISILIKLVSPGGPVIYKQKRVGRKGKIFDLYKFRTMIPDAEKYTGPILATGDDPRNTPIGKFLRTTRLDELPQLFNILKGDMSFVGPRPERPVFVEEFKEFIPKYMERHKVRPGIAGWAQFLGGYHLPAEEKIKYDLYYIENWSFLLDIKILLKCIQVAFTFQKKIDRTQIKNVNTLN